jgi:hypothetical protein
MLILVPLKDGSLYDMRTCNVAVSPCFTLTLDGDRARLKSKGIVEPMTLKLAAPCTGWSVIVTTATYVPGVFRPGGYAS